MKYALLIGINYDTNENLILEGCVDDVLKVKHILIDKCNVEKENIVILRDDIDSLELQPTHIHILQELENLTKKTTQDDEVYVYYSGHGSVRRDRNGDERTNIDSVIVPVDFQTTGYILDDTMFSILQNMKAKSLLCFDSCNSGTVCDLPWLFSYVSEEMTEVEQVNVEKIENPNIYTISGSADDQTSVEVFDIFYMKKVGVFTRAFLASLEHYKYDACIMDIYRKLCENIQKQGFEQRPTLCSSSTNISFHF
mgnify:CR=1 FL=1|tara:strand:+ start:81 stop:839 length:759 start_codon:yes stop_codon:yes gene_type:complete